LTLAISASDFYGKFPGLKVIGSIPYGTFVDPLLTAINFKRSLHSYEKTDPKVLGIDYGYAYELSFNYYFYPPVKMPAIF
jgi:hypothetical protein